MPLSVWGGLVAEHHCRCSPSRLGLFASVSLASVFNSIAGGLTTLTHGRRIRCPPQTPPPVFIIGHWRSGTTLLH
ncbi:MAG: sulfotransferase, partial [Pirellulales bacterium]